MRVDVGQPIAPVLRHGNRLMRRPPLPRIPDPGHYRGARQRRALLRGVAA